MLIWGENRDRDKNSIMINDDDDDIEDGELVIVGYRSRLAMMGVIKEKDEEYDEEEDED